MLASSQLKTSAAKWSLNFWWILANLIGWYLGWVIGIAILRSIGILYLPWVGGLEVKQHGILGVSAGLTSGLGTGLLLMWLLRNRAL